MDLVGNTAIAMGHYVFTVASGPEQGSEVRVEFTFGYKRDAMGTPRIFLHHSSRPYNDALPAGPPPTPQIGTSETNLMGAGARPISEADVHSLQAQWGQAIKDISAAHLADGGWGMDEANAAAEALYGYGKSNVVFKPTKAAEYPFRPTPTGALSYFVGGANVEGGYTEDGGFAHNGGMGWSDVEFQAVQVFLNGPIAISMGHYIFTVASGPDMGQEVKVEFTFGYKRDEEGTPRIFLHHSSMPWDFFTGATAQLAPITEADVLNLQAQWGQAIKDISAAYLANGDFMAEANAAAGALYGYGHTDVLFKPTKAAEYPFRPTPVGALSYFVGGDNVDGGFLEDGGFAHNGGKGWSEVQFENVQMDLGGNTAIAMGHYIFTVATGPDMGSEVRVEFTFGYKRDATGTPRIFLHHSSNPFTGVAPNPLVLQSMIDTYETNLMGAGARPITEAEVHELQGQWGQAIKDIS